MGLLCICITLVLLNITGSLYRHSANGKSQSFGAPLEGPGILRTCGLRGWCIQNKLVQTGSIREDHVWIVFGIDELQRQCLPPAYQSQYSPISKAAFGHSAGDDGQMLTEIYLEALLVNEVLADLVWEAWDAGGITEDVAASGRGWSEVE